MVFVLSFSYVQSSMVYMLSFNISRNALQQEAKLEQEDSEDDFPDADSVSERCLLRLEVDYRSLNETLHRSEDQRIKARAFAGFVLQQVLSERTAKTLAELVFDWCKTETETKSSRIVSWNQITMSCRSKPMNSVRERVILEYPKEGLDEI